MLFLKHSPEIRKSGFDKLKQTLCKNKVKPSQALSFSESPIFFRNEVIQLTFTHFTSGRLVF